MEIERAFILEPDVIPHDLSELESTHIKQWYLSFATDNSLEARVRCKTKGNDEAKYELQFKGGHGQARTESSALVLSDDFVAQLNLEERPSVEKIRYAVSGPKGETFEIDVYLAGNEGLVKVEVEFDSIEAANSFQVPNWFGEEVTEILNMRNAGLALKPLANR